MKIKTINIKEDFPPADVAVANMEIEIENLAGSEVLALKVIHGYGSHGVGGEIKKQAIVKLKELRNKQKILNFIPGEQFGISVSKDKYLRDNIPELFADPELYFPNSGITVVLLKKKDWFN